MMARKGGGTGEAGRTALVRRAPQAPKPKEQRTTAPQFLREVRAELRKVVWPTRSETINYSLIVLVTLIFFTALIFAVDWVFSEFVLRLFDIQ